MFRFKLFLLAAILPLFSSISFGQYVATGTRPALPPAPAGAPGGSSWATGDLVRAYEDDGVTGDDFIDNATVSGTTAKLELSQGTVNLLMSEWFEGECIEIEFFWSYWTWVKVEEWRAGPHGWVLVSYWKRVKQTVASDLYWICP